MTATAVKRALPPKVAAMKARKRRKLDGNISNKADQKPVRKTGVKADSLAWKSVSMPDHLDDYEGFFGLEEVEDVDIVKDAETGQISFTTYHASQEKSQVAISAEFESDGDVQEQAGTEGEEWSGFDDSHVRSETSTAPLLDQDEPLHTAKPKLKKAKQATADLKDETDPTSQQNSTFQFLRTAEVSDSVDVSAWKNLKLSPDTLAALSGLKFSSPTPIQEATVPEILSGHDVIGKASTGSGKTLAFGIPILETFLEQYHNLPQSKDRAKSPLALILSPTRELAHQLDKHLTDLCSNGIFERPVIATLTGGLAVQKQQRFLQKADIVIGTPGRLWEVISEGHGIIKALKGIRFLVVDEADRLLSDGHFKEVEEILGALDREEQSGDEQEEKIEVKKQSLGAKVGANMKPGRQTLVFSATFDRNLQRNLASRKFKPDNNLMDRKDTLQWLLSKLNFREEAPKFIDVNPVNQLATGLREGLIECAGTEKDLYLYTLLLLHSNARTLIFANSINAVRRLTPLVQNLQLPALALHSGMPQKARLRSVERFKEGSCSILVATDVASRGLDIPQVQSVIHYHLPRAADTYVHRSGRTARAGLSGTSILICAPEEVIGIRRLVAKVHASTTNPAEVVGGGRQGGYFIRTLDIDRRIVSRLKPRVTLAKKIADATIAKERRSKEDDFMRAAAEELGVEYDSDEFEAEGSKGRRGRGTGRKKKERDAAGLSKGEVGAFRAELNGLLKQRVNVGVSERYLTSGRVDVDELLRQQEAGSGNEFLGNVQHGLFD